MFFGLFEVIVCVRVCLFLLTRGGIVITIDLVIPDQALCRLHPPPPPQLLVFTFLSSVHCLQLALSLFMPNIKGANKI